MWCAAPLNAKARLLGGDGTTRRVFPFLLQLRQSGIRNELLHWNRGKASQALRGQNYIQGLTVILDVLLRVSISLFTLQSSKPVFIGAHFL